MRPRRGYRNEGWTATGTEPTGSGNRHAAVSVEGLTKVFGRDGRAVPAIDDVSFSVESASAVGLLGPNGAGKTTTIKALLGLVVPSAGSARIGGVDVQADRAAVYRRVGVMLEGARNVYWRLTVRENLRFFAALAGHRPSDVRRRHDTLLEQFGLADRADTPVRELSRGMRQKVSLAATLARDADVVFLDEPTLGLDVESSLELRAELRRLVEDEGMTVLVSSHDMAVIEAVCSRVIVMVDGAVVADDSVENLLEAFRTQTYEVRVGGAVPAAVRSQLAARFDASDFDRRGRVERFVAPVTGDEFFGLVDVLRAAGLSVASVDVIEPDLEEVFLRLTDRNGGADR